MRLDFLITRTIYETPTVSQRALAKKFFVSLGKINSIINEIVEDGLVKRSDREGTYKITEKGKKLLDMHKVDGAIILACGLGVKLSHDSKELPICFLEINGERLIERQIEQLKSAGIDDITIMVGFMKEKFDYLIDKYDVKLVYNDEYRYKKTLSTFYHARELLRGKNMYVCVSDVYINENIYHKYEIESYHTGVYYEDCKNEWRYIVNVKNEIKEVVVGGTNDFCFLGTCFMTKDFLSKLIPLIEEYYKKSFTDDYYWENVLVQNFSKLPKMYLYKLGEREILEFDNLKDLNDYKKYSSVFSKTIIDYVSKALKVDKKNIKDIKCIKENVANLLYSFRTDDEDLIIRIPKENANEFIDRKNEAEIINKLNKLSGPYENVINFNEDNGYKISKYIKFARPLNIKSKAELKNCMAVYKKLHTSGVKVRGSCDMIDMIDRYYKVIKTNDILIPYEDFDIVLDRAREIKKYIEKQSRPRTICHGDPNPDNILVTDDGLKLTDFEYGGMADPLSDIALFGVYVGFDEEKVFKLYEMYKDAEGKNIFLPKSDNEAKKLIALYMALGGLYNAIWDIVRVARDDVDYGTFGMAGYRAFKNYSKKIHIK